MKASALHFAPLLVALAAVALPAAETRRHGDLRIPDTLKPGQTAPDFRLRTVDGAAEVQLSDYRGKQPVILVFGSYTCPPFREHVGTLESLFDRYRDRVAFHMVYIKEAHPSDGWAMARNQRQGIALKDAATLAERAAAAQTACTTLKIKLPCLVDGMDNATNQAYAAWPDRIYVIDAAGKVAVMGATGPAGFAPSVKATRAWLERSFPPPAR
ncbi:MAG: deiodinase-like protein [Opitutaceae bacterium]